jgi:hypothetical protein
MMIYIFTGNLETIYIYVIFCSTYTYVFIIFFGNEKVASATGNLDFHWKPREKNIP